MSAAPKVKQLLWISSAKRDLMKMPPEVRSDFGFGLYQVQVGKRPNIGKVLSGLGGANVVELVADHQGNTFRAVYTVKFSNAIAVLHAFQKKSKSGIATPKQDIELIRSRLKMAEEVYKKWKGGTKI